METEEAIKSRRSIRHFLKKPIPKEIINEMIEDALWSPSWGNTQPWEFVVATGPVLEQFQKENREAFLAGKKGKADIPVPEKWPDINKERYNELGKNLFSSISIARDDHDGRLQYYGQMFSLFDAPALLLILLNKELLLEYAMLDVGLFMQTFFLLAQDRGIGTIPLAVSINYPDIIRKLFPVPENKRIVIGIALGWPDPDAPINCFERKRGAKEEFVQWVGP